MKTIEVDDYVYETIKYHSQGIRPALGAKKAIEWEVEFMLNHHLVEMFVLLVDPAFEGVIRRMDFEQLTVFANAYMYALHSHDKKAVVVRNTRGNIVGVTTPTGSIDLCDAHREDRIEGVNTPTGPVNLADAPKEEAAREPCHNHKAEKGREEEIDILVQVNVDDHVSKAIKRGSQEFIEYTGGSEERAEAMFIKFVLTTHFLLQFRQVLSAGTFDRLRRGGPFDRGLMEFYLAYDNAKQGTDGYDFIRDAYDKIEAVKTPKGVII